MAEAEEPEDATPVPDAASPAGYPIAGDDAMPNDGGATRLLTGLMRASPFLDLDERAGGDSRWRRRVCFTLDAIVRGVVVIALLGVIVGIAWKTLAPFPSP